MKPWIPILFLLLLALFALPVLGQTAVPTPDPAGPVLPVIALPPQALQAPTEPARPTAVSGKLDATLDQIAGKRHSLAIPLYVAGAKTAGAGDQIEVLDAVAAWRTAAATADQALEDVLTLLRAEVAP